MFNEDLTEFLDDTELADQGTVSGEAVNGIFENAFSDEFGIESDTPTFIVSSNDANVYAHGDIVTINSDLIQGGGVYLLNSDDYIANDYFAAQTTFKVVGIQPDGTGLTSLILKKE